MARGGAASAAVKAPAKVAVARVAVARAVVVVVGEKGMGTPPVGVGRTLSVVPPLTRGGRARCPPRR